MKKRTTTAILLSTTIMLTLMGCGSASSEATSETGEVTESQTETNSDTDSKTEDKDADAKSEEGSEDASKTSDAAVTSDEASFEYKGKTLSFTDDAQTVIDALDSVGEPLDHNGSDGVEGLKWYNWDKIDKNDAKLSMATQDEDGKVIVGYLSSLRSEDFKTSKGISAGSSLEDVKAAYGDPSNEKQLAENASMVIYKFSSFEILFFIDNGKVDSINYQVNNFKG